MNLYRTENKNRPIEAHRPALSKQELESVLDCLIEDRLGSGDITRRFEKSFANAFGFRHAVAAHSRAAAYHLAYIVSEVGTGARVLMSAIAPVEACDAARYVGATPEIIDVARNSFHPDPEEFEKRAEEIRAEHPDQSVVVVLDHSFGCRSPLKTTRLRDSGIKIVEDFTGMLGSEYEGEVFGKSGHISICGTSETDMITTGNGAMVVTPDSKIFKALMQLCYGSRRSRKAVAYDYRMEDFRAAMGLDQIPRVGITLQRRRKIGTKYMESLRTTRHETYFSSPDVDAFHRFPVVFNKNLDEVLRYFASLHIGVDRAVENPLHHMLDLPRMEFPNAERLYQRAAAIPIYPALTANNVERVSSSLRGLI